MSDAFAPHDPLPDALPVAGYRPDGHRHLDFGDATPPPSPTTAELKAHVFRLLGRGAIGCQWPDGCDVTAMDQLCIDHLEDDGAHDRREQKRKGERLYQHILRQWEADPQAARLRYQLLCFSHNRQKERNRQATRGQGQTAPLPVERSRRQIRLVVSADTDDYLEQHATATHPKGAIVDFLFESHRSVGARLLAIERLLEARLLPPSADPSGPAASSDATPLLETPAVQTPPEVSPEVSQESTYEPWTRSLSRRRRWPLWDRR